MFMAHYKMLSCSYHFPVYIVYFSQSLQKQRLKGFTVYIYMCTVCVKGLWSTLWEHWTVYMVRKTQHTNNYSVHTNTKGPSLNKPLISARLKVSLASSKWSSQHPGILQEAKLSPGMFSQWTSPDSIQNYIMLPLDITLLCPYTVVSHAVSHQYYTITH
jgi:hypothetical protein